MRLAVMILVVSLFISLTITSASAIDKVDTLFFSLKAPDTWTYQTASNSGMASLLGYGPVNSVMLVPSEFANLITIEDSDEFNEEFNKGGVLVSFTQDPDYSIKNAPIETYVNHKVKEFSDIGVTSQENTTVGKEEAVRFAGNGTTTDNEYVGYLMLHDEDPYFTLYTANAKDFDKYLPEFEQMVKSFRFK